MCVCARVCVCGCVCACLPACVYDILRDSYILFAFNALLITLFYTFLLHSLQHRRAYVIYVHTYIHTYIHVCMHTYILKYIYKCIIHTSIQRYKHSYILFMDVSVAEWLAWLTSNCGRIGAIGSSPSNGLIPNM